MPTIERSTRVAAPADALFAYLGEVGNLPDYFPDIVEAHAEDGDHVRVAARIPDGTTRAGEAWFRVDEGRRRIEWGADDDAGYHGWLEVRDEADGAEVHLGLTMRHDDVDGSIDRTLATIRERAEAAA